MGFPNHLWELFEERLRLAVWEGRWLGVLWNLLN